MTQDTDLSESVRYDDELLGRRDSNSSRRFSMLGSDVDFLTATVALDLDRPSSNNMTRRHSMHTLAPKTVFRQHRRLASAPDLSSLLAAELEDSWTCSTSTESSPDDDEPSSSLSTAESLSLAMAFGGLVASGVCSTVAFERLNVMQPGCGQVITLLQYIATVTEKSPKASQFLSKRVVPLPIHVACVLLMFATAFFGNLCLAYDLPFCTYLIIKNSNLVFSMLVGAVALGRRYKASQVVAVFMVSTGVILSILSQQGQDDASSKQQSASPTSSALIGAALCTASTLSVSCLGCLQEYVFTRCRVKDADGDATTIAAEESMFYIHFLGLPLFLTSGIQSHVNALLSQWQTAVPLGLVNVISSVLCKKCFFLILDQSSSLTATLAGSIFRFVCIVMSACAIVSQQREIPGSMFWLGALTVASGSLLYLYASSTAAKQKRE